MLLLDVVRSGAAPGTIHELELAALVDASLAQAQVSSHGFGPAEALRLAAALGRSLPPGRFVGVEGARFDLGAACSPEVVAAREGFAAAALRALARLRGELSQQTAENPENSENLENPENPENLENLENLENSENRECTSPG